MSSFQLDELRSYMSKVVHNAPVESETSSGKANWVALGVLTVGVVLGVAWLFLSNRDSTPTGDSRSRSEALELKEQDLYTAMDSKDPSRVADALEELASEDEGVRLAALRYLTSNGVSSDPRLLGLLNDKVDRVRRAAIQLIGASCKSDPEVAEKLRAISSDPDAGMAEKTLATQALTARD